MDEQRETQTFPDARIAAEGFRVIADQLDTCAQFVEFTSPHRIEIMIGESLRPLHDAMNAMVQRFDGMETRFNQRFDALQSTVDTTNATVNSLQAQMNLLDTKILSGNRNAAARSQNSTIVRSDVEIHPFYSLQTGNLIVNFPRTTSALDRLSSAAIDDMLGQLDIIPSGRVDARRRQFKQAIGIVLQVV